MILKEIFIVDYEYERENFFRYDKNHQNRQIGILSIPTLDRAENLQAGRFEPSDFKSIIKNDIFVQLLSILFFENDKMAKIRTR